jgi:DNA repair protein RadC
MIIDAARQAVDFKMQRGELLGSSAVVDRYLQDKLGGLDHEVFAILHLDIKNRLIEFSEIFRGSINNTAVHVREVVKEALRRNSASVVIAHYVARHIMRVMCPTPLCGASQVLL